MTLANPIYISIVTSSLYYCRALLPLQTPRTIALQSLMALHPPLGLTLFDFSPKPPEHYFPSTKTIQKYIQPTKPYSRPLLIICLESGCQQKPLQLHGSCKKIQSDISEFSVISITWFCVTIINNPTAQTCIDYFRDLNKVCQLVTKNTLQN